MDKDSNTNYGGIGGGLPPTGRFPGSNVKPEPSDEAISSFPVPPPASDFSMFSHDLSRMTDNPQQKIGHRRAHSEILTLPDDITFDSDLGVVGGADGPSLSDETEEDLFSMYLDMDKVNSSSATSMFQSEPSSAGPPQLGNVSGDGRPRIRHQHSQSMDGSTTIKPEMLVSGGEESSAADSRKAMSAAKLAELALVDPKRAKRIWANRQSAARSKERKMRYIAELERRLQALQTEATTLSAQLNLLQRDTNGLSSENNELKLRLQTMDQQIHLQDALNDALKDEIQHLKMLTGQAMPSSQALYSNNNQQQAMQTLLTAQQFQQLQIQSQKQHQLQQLQQMQQQQEQFRGSPSLRENTSDMMALGPKD